MRKFVKGDKVIVARQASTNWVTPMDAYIGGTYTVREVFSNSLSLEEDHGYVKWYFPFDALDLVSNEVPEFHVGDVVRVIKKVNAKEEGWNNCWVDQMDNFIGNKYTISRIGQNGVYFTDNTCLGFPPSSLELVKSIHTTNKNIVKYQYITPNVDEVELFPEFKNLCLSISTEVITVGNKTEVQWAVAFKNPKDQFSKVEARKVLASKTAQKLYVNSSYTHHEIVSKILCALYYDAITLPDHYKDFVRYQMIVAFYKAGLI